MGSQIERQIRDALALALAELPWARKIEPYKIRLGFSELREHEVPYIQFYGLGQTFLPDRTELETTWQIAVDLILKQGADGLIDQRDLDDKRQEILEAVGKDPRLGINIIHIIPTSSTDDLNLFNPFYATTIVFEARYRKRYVRDC